MGVSEEQVQDVATMAEAAELGKRLLVLTVEHKGRKIGFRSRPLNSYDEERIEAAYPEPAMPVQILEGGARFPDQYDAGYLDGKRKCDRSRALLRVALVLGQDFFGGEPDTKKQVDALKREFQPWQIALLSNQAQAPKAVTEEDVRREAIALYPTFAALAAAS